MKPKINRVGSTNKSDNFDRCQTPAYALDPLLPYLRKEWTIWECAAGEKNLAHRLVRAGFFDVYVSDIIDGANFFDFQPYLWDCIVTNPPYSIKYQWIRRCYELDKPFALLMPLETLGAAKANILFDRYGIELIVINPRINFKMPNKGYSGNGAQFPTAWFTWRLGIGKTITFAKVTPRFDIQLDMI